MRLGSVFAASALVLAIEIAGIGAPADTSVDWIKELPGVSVTAQKDSGGELEVVYGVSGDVIATFDRIREGLAKRGWTIEKTSDSSALMVTQRILTASNEGATVEVVASRTGPVQDIVLKRRGGSAPSRSTSGAGASSGTRAKPAETKTAESSLTSGARIDLVQDNLTGTYECKGSRVSLSGNRGNITLNGKCTYLVVNGSDNTVRVQGSVEAITAVGSNNVVIWSAAQNPDPPRITNIGSGNEILKK